MIKAKSLRLFINVVVIVSLQYVAPMALALDKSDRDTATATAETAIFGDVLINGEPAVSGTTFFSRSSILTVSNSTAIVSSAGVGRIEVLKDTSLELEVSKHALTCRLIKGAIRVSTTRGVTSEVQTKDGRILSDSTADAMFSVSVAEFTTFSRFAGGVTAEQHGDIRAVQSGNLFRTAMGDLGARPSVKRADTASDKARYSLAILLISVGAVLAAITRMAPNNDRGFLRIGGSISTDPAGS